jgi:hypothetical protein
MSILQFRVVFALTALIAALSAAALTARTASAEEITINATGTMAPAPTGGFITCVTPPGVDPLVVPRVLHAQESFEGLGEATMVGVYESCAVTSVGLEFVGHSIRTFEDGSKWYVSWTGTVDPTTGALVVHGHDIDRGTGRFAGATAALEASGTFDASTAAGEYTITGTVNTATFAPPSTGDGGLADASGDNAYIAWTAIAAAFALSMLFAVKAGRVQARK